MLAKVVDGESVIPSVINIWRVADLLEREVFDFYGILFLGHPDMRRLYLRNDFKGHPFRKDWKGDDKYSLEEDVEPDYGLQYDLNKNGELVVKKNALFTDQKTTLSISDRNTLLLTVCSACKQYSTARP